MKLYTSEKAFLENGVELGKDFYLLTDHPLPTDTLTKRATYDLHRKYKKESADYTSFYLGRLTGFQIHDRHIFSISSNVFDEHDETPITNYDFLYEPNSGQLFPLNGKAFHESVSFKFYLNGHEYEFDEAIATYSSIDEPESTTFVDFMLSDFFNEEYLYYQIRAY
ncbi:hypothetical protein AU074_13935 [Pseudomonas sp. ATCC PTA-122608]|uniref:hypothetical protein n=1 Tax=Pseudomonas sp. ATCC PTA-122608 TaxID=1771311 RepID=UPI00096B8700|nr:hypothetical protein [Pseudomonas sp. ATCC PTA-122608]OLY72271.1 hypothetical protein AU074_13935 [Pseudomonas sp. ATCC PTA-122608]